MKMLNTPPPAYVIDLTLTVYIAHNLMSPIPDFVMQYSYAPPLNPMRNSYAPQNKKNKVV